MTRFCRIVARFLLGCTCCAATGEVHKVLIRDVATVEGVRDNSLIGYGLVVGLKGTGDRQQTYFTGKLSPAFWLAWACRFQPLR